MKPVITHILKPVLQQSTGYFLRIIYLFIDGIGIGLNDPDKNPFARYSNSIFSCLAGKDNNVPEGIFTVPTDAHMGITGLPQSATGQTSLWTGLNGPAIMGRHMTGFPGPTLVRAIHEHSIIKTFIEKGKKATLLNAYTLPYFEKIIKNPRLASASTHVQLASGQAPKTMDDLESGKAIYMDINNEVLIQLHPEWTERFPVVPSFEKGKDLVLMARDYDLVIFEYFLTDKAGHEQSFPYAKHTIKTVENFISGILSEINPEEELLLISSDHGNLEDLSTKTHTNNPVMTFGYGARADEMESHIKELKDIPHFIYRINDMEDLSELLMNANYVMNE